MIFVVLKLNLTASGLLPIYLVSIPEMTGLLDNSLLAVRLWCSRHSPDFLNSTSNFLHFLPSDMRQFGPITGDRTPARHSAPPLHWSKMFYNHSTQVREKLNVKFEIFCRSGLRKKPSFFTFFNIRSSV